MSGHRDELRRVQRELKVKLGEAGGQTPAEQCKGGEADNWLQGWRETTRGLPGDGQRAKLLLK